MFDDDDGIADVSSFNEALAGEEFYLMEEYEGPARSNGGSIVGAEVPDGVLNAKDLGPEIDGDAGRRLVRRLDLDPCAALLIPDFDFAAELEVMPGGVLCDDPGLAECLDVGECAAVKDGDLGIVDADLGIVYAHSRQGRKDVLYCDRRSFPAGNRGAARSVGDIVRKGFYAGVTEIGTDKADAGACSGRPYVHVCVLPGMQALSFEITGIGKGILSHLPFCLKMA